LEALGQDGGQHGAHAGRVEAAEVAEQGVLVGLEAVTGELEGGERHAQLAAVEQQEGLF